MMAAARLASASGAGESFFRCSMALSAMPLLGPSFAARSNSTVSTPALVRCAAICAPMTPAPSTAALRMRSADVGEDAAVIGFSGCAKGGTDGSGMAEAGDGKTDQVLRGLLAVRVLADVAFALDHAEA